MASLISFLTSATSIIGSIAAFADAALASIQVAASGLGAAAFSAMNFMAANAMTSLSHAPAAVIQSFVYALLGGLLPALIWLWFWMHESHDHHEPKHTLWLTFICGMCAVFFIFPLQKFAEYVTGAQMNSWTIILIWAALEEIIKYLAAYGIALRDKKNAYDEPIDAFVYLMTAALGFAAMENTLFLLGPLLQGQRPGDDHRGLQGLWRHQGPHHGHRRRLR